MRDVVLIPTFNERENIQSLIPEIFRLQPDIHILVIDDNSPDRTAVVVRELMASYSNLSLLSRPEKQGLGEAYKDALARLQHDTDVRFIFTMDADGSHDPQMLASFIRELAEHDLVIGSRYVKGGGVGEWSGWRRALSAGGNWYARVLTGLEIQDLTAGFLGFRRPMLEAINWSQLSAAGYAFLMEFKFFILTMGGRVKEVPITFHQRRGGESKISPHIIREGLKTPWRLFYQRLWR